MKQTPDLDRVQQKMQPGEISLHGFLGRDTRKLADILRFDEELVHSRGIAHSQIAEKLADLAQRGKDIAEREVVVDDRYKVRVRDDRGVLPSPWGDGRFCKGDVEMTDEKTGKRFRWNELTVHMIRDYGFYGGVGSAYRIEPAEAIEALNLKPDAESETPVPTPET